MGKQINVSSKRKKKRFQRCRYHKIIAFPIVLVLVFLTFSSITPLAEAFFKWDRSSELSSTDSNTLSIVEISELRVREIKRRLMRQHGYGSDEVARMIDKKELVNALSYEEHKEWQKKEEKKKMEIMRRGIIVALICISLAIFRQPLFMAWEVVCVNVVVYVDKKRYEINRCRELHSFKGFFGIFIMMIINALQQWLSVSVILSWFITSRYLFPIPNIPIRPAAMLATVSGNAVGGGPLSHYGINVGSMGIRWIFSYLNRRLEIWLGKVFSAAVKRERKKYKSVIKKREKADAAKEKADAAKEKRERKEARAARRSERETRKQEALKKVVETASSTTKPMDCDSISSESVHDLPTKKDVRDLAAEAATVRKKVQEDLKTDGPCVIEECSEMDELD